MWRDHGTPTDSYYLVRPECTDVPKTKFKIKAGKTLSVRKWQAAFSPEGQLDIGRTLGRIYRGGIHPDIRGEVWEFLLGCYDPGSTRDERDQIRQRRRSMYSVLKEECKQMFPVVGSGRFITAPIITEDGDPIQDPIVLLETNTGNGVDSVSPENDDAGAQFSSAMVKEEDKRIIQWKLTLHQIGLDVVRTDRTLVFYEKQENLSKLWDILSVYAWFDRDIGYCQGMSDLCSPMIMLFEDEADAFWCFERLMRKMRANFRCTERSVGVETQLSSLAAVIQVIDPKLHQHLETLGGGDYLFAFRMLMVLFRREFSFGDSLHLWEMMWALEYDPELFSVYEDPDSVAEKAEGSKGKAKSSKQFGKYEREYIKSGARSADAPLPISVFLVANVLKERSPKLLSEARGLDDVVKILNDITGNLDARKACIGAMKLHKKYLKKMMWALEYDPELFSVYEDPDSVAEKAEGSKGKAKSSKQFGKYEREYIKSGARSADAPLPISVFLVANVLKERSPKLLSEARGLDDVVKILNDITGNLDARKACIGAMKLHKKYLKKKTLLAKNGGVA